MQEPRPGNDVVDSLELLHIALMERPTPEQVLKILLSYAGKWDGFITRPRGKPEKAMFQPIYNANAVETVWHLANQPIFTRLKEVHQLGTTRLFKNVDAGHTRWAHSLGVVSILGECLTSLRAHGVEISEEWEKVTLFAGLLHDAMQGPWSHSLEFVTDIFPREHDGKMSRWDKVLVRAELANENSPLYRMLYWEFKQLGLAVDPGDLVNKTGIILDCEICAKLYPEWVFLAQLIDSDIDTDRMEYLIRDNRFLGRLKEDEYIAAVESVIRSMTVTNYVVGGKNLRILAFAESTREQICTLLNLRQELYQDVYEHPDNVAVDEMIGHALFYILRSRGFFEISRSAGAVETRVGVGLLRDVARTLGLITDSQFSDAIPLLSLARDVAESKWAVQLNRDAQVNPFEPLDVYWVNNFQRETINERVDSVLERAEECLIKERAQRKLLRSERLPDPCVRDTWHNVLEEANFQFEEKLGLFSCLVNTYGKKLAVEAEFWSELLSVENFHKELTNFLDASFGPRPYFQVKHFVDIPLVHISVPWHPLLRKSAPYTTEVQSELPCVFYKMGADGQTTYNFEPVTLSPGKTWLPFLSCPEWLNRFQGSFISQKWHEFIERDYDKWIVRD